jgi:Protein of unknown function (DUF2961)
MMKNSVTLLFFFVCCIGVLGISLSLHAQAGETGEPRPFDNLFVLRDTKTVRISSYDRAGGNEDFIKIEPGETKTIAEISGTGIIRRFYVAPYAGDRMRSRKVIVRMYWDGEKEPCVEVPLGDFFGSGLGTLRHFHSAAVDVNPGFDGFDFDGMVSYLPMPFAKGARITVENDSDMKDYILYYHVEYEQYPYGKLPPNSGRFHAQWHHVVRTPVKPGLKKNTQEGGGSNLTGTDNYVALDAVGRGTYVGLFLTVDNLPGGWYGEGDDMIFIDGAKWPPSYSGTGHEEIFNAGACPDKEFAGLYTGFYLIEDLHSPWRGKNQMYHFYVNEPVIFQKDIRVTIEHGHNNNFENSYTSTAFWYQSEPHKAFPPLLAAKDRLPLWPEGVQEALDKEASLRGEVAGILSAGKIKLSPQDGAQWQQLEIARNKEFHGLKYDDFILDVNAADKIAEKYRHGAGGDAK